MGQTKDGRFLVWWGYAMKADGRTQCSTCGYCMHIYQARAKRQKKTLTLWKIEMGESTGKLLEVHVHTVKVLISMIVEKGCNFRAHVSWTDADRRVLVLEKSQRMKIQKPGYAWEPLWYYNATRGLLDEDKRKKGHREYKYGGEDGILMPDAPTVKINFEEILQVIHARGRVGGCLADRPALPYCHA